MEKNKQNKTIKILNYISLIPYIGYIIVLFVGAFKVEHYKKGKQYTLSFMLLSMICLAIFGAIAFLIVVLFIVNQEFFKPIVIIAISILFYVAFLCAAISTNAVLKWMLNKFVKQEENDITNNLY